MSEVEEKPIKSSLKSVQKPAVERGGGGGTARVTPYPRHIFQLIRGYFNQRRRNSCSSPHIYFMIKCVG